MAVVGHSVNSEGINIVNLCIFLFAVFVAGLYVFGECGVCSFLQANIRGFLVTANLRISRNCSTFAI